MSPLGPQTPVDSRRSINISKGWVKTLNQKYKAERGETVRPGWDTIEDGRNLGAACCASRLHPHCREQGLQKGAVLVAQGPRRPSRHPAVASPAVGRGSWGRGQPAKQEMGKAGVRPAGPWGRRRGAPRLPFLSAWNVGGSASRPPARVGAGRPGLGDLPAPGTPRGT